MSLFSLIFFSSQNCEVSLGSIILENVYRPLPWRFSSGFVVIIDLYHTQDPRVPQGLHMHVELSPPSHQ